MQKVTVQGLSQLAVVVFVLAGVAHLAASAVAAVVMAVAGFAVQKVIA